MKKKSIILVLALLLTNYSIAQCWNIIDATSSNRILIKADGSLWIWSGCIWGGAAFWDQLIIRQVGNVNWIKADSGSETFGAIKTDGTLWGWRKSNCDDDYNPVQVGTATNWADVKVGYRYTIALKTNGTLWAWGDNSFGQLGNGTTTDNLAPTQIEIGTNWAKIEVNSGSAFAIKTDGTLWAWGLNNYGQLGDGTTINKLVPTQIGIASNWSNIDAGGYHSIAIRTTGSLYAWGRNHYGQLGDGTIIDKLSPNPIGFATNWSKIAADEYGSYSIKTDGSFWRWGGLFLEYGAGGDFVNESHIPLSVACPTTLSNSNFTIAITFKIFPNPINEIVNIESEIEKIKNIEIIDFLGKVVLRKNIDSFNSTLNVSNFQKGIYLLKVNIENETKTYKIVKN